MIGLVKMGRYRKVISPVDDIPAVLSKAVRQPSSSLSNVHYRWTFGARQTINHVISDTGKMSRDVNMPFGCCNCGWWIDMGTCAATCPVTRKSTWWLVWKVSTNDFPGNQVPGMEGGDKWCSLSWDSSTFSWPSSIADCHWLACLRSLLRSKYDLFIAWTACCGYVCCHDIYAQLVHQQALREVHNRPLSQWWFWPCPPGWTTCTSTSVATRVLSRHSAAMLSNACNRCFG